MENRRLISEIKKCIENQLKKGQHNFLIFPYGDVGIQVKMILQEVYDVRPKYILDNHLCDYNPKIKPLSFLKEIDTKKYILILASTNPSIYSNLKKLSSQFINSEQIIELESMINYYTFNSELRTTIGKYSYGPLCRTHELIESIGSFCSFAKGTDVVPNHELNYLTTHPIISWGQHIRNIEIDYESYKSLDWYFEGIKPKQKCKKINRSKIGNDVWFGRNVIVTNGANIGNGVIAGAGSIITKDIPDYAIVVGVPAKIVRYRYTQPQIDALNAIQWWNWTDEEIRERYDDFYLPIEEFIHKYFRA